MRASEVIKEHERRIARLETAFVELSKIVHRTDPELDFDIDVKTIKPVAPRIEGDAEWDPVRGYPVAKGHTFREQYPDQEPETSRVLGGSTEEQKVAYREWVRLKEEAEQRERGLVEEGDVREIAPPTDKQALMRKQLAEEIGWEHWERSEEYESTPLTPEAATRAYIAGGPIWLVHYDRDFVKQQTMATRQRMVEDVMLTSVELANELSADILKYEESNDPSVATDAAHADWDGA